MGSAPVAMNNAAPSTTLTLDTSPIGNNGKKMQPEPAEGSGAGDGGAEDGGAGGVGAGDSVEQAQGEGEAGPSDDLPKPKELTKFQSFEEYLVRGCSCKHEII